MVFIPTRGGDPRANLSKTTKGWGSVLLKVPSAPPVLKKEGRLSWGGQKKGNSTPGAAGTFSTRKGERERVVPSVTGNKSGCTVL